MACSKNETRKGVPWNGFMLLAVRATELMEPLCYRTVITEAQLRDAPEFGDDFLGRSWMGDADALLHPTVLIVINGS